MVLGRFSGGGRRAADRVDHPGRRRAGRRSTDDRMAEPRVDSMSMTTVPASPACDHRVMGETIVLPAQSPRRTELEALGWTVVAGAVVIGATAAIAGLARPKAHQRARLRSFGDALETAAVIAIVPMGVGVFGIYADLLALFGGGA